MRVLVLLQSGIWSSIFAVADRIKYNKQIINTPVPSRPVFIIGHWRTGSTFLHQLMIQDDNFVSPSVFQVTVPDCFVSIEKYYKPVMRKVMGSRRPMDNVRFGPDAPQEDEFALFRMTLNSPLQSVIFPKTNRYFLLENDNMICDNSKITRWEKSLLFFCKKLCMGNNRQLLIKSPFHSMRINILNKLFPDAVFIHIFRNPYDVVPSTIRMWDIIARQNCLNNKWEKPSTREVVSLLKKMINTINRELKLLESNRYTVVKYEDLEASPVEEIKRIYRHLNLSFTQELEEKIGKFLDEEKDFQKNTHQLSESDKAIIYEEMSEFMVQNNYIKTYIT